MFRLKYLATLILGTALTASCFGVVRSAHWQRQLYGDLQAIQKEKDRTDTEWRRLLLEEATLASHTRIEQIARRDLDMVRGSEARSLDLAQ